MSWLDPIILWFKDGVQLPVHRRIALGANLIGTDEPAYDRIRIDAVPRATYQSIVAADIGDSGPPDLTAGYGSDAGIVLVGPRNLVRVRNTSSAHGFQISLVDAGGTAGDEVEFKIDGNSVHAIGIETTVDGNRGGLVAEDMLKYVHDGTHWQYWFQHEESIL